MKNKLRCSVRCIKYLANIITLVSLSKNKLESFITKYYVQKSYVFSNDVLKQIFSYNLDI